MTELKSNTEWKQWGKDDPLWAVAAWANRQKEGTSPWTEEEFYALGQSDWQDFLGQWRQYGINARSCLEIGCGAGRITRQLAMSFDRVYAVDVSEQMISCARKATDRRNVEFSIIDGLHLPHGDCSVGAVFSTHVLQHLDSVDVGFSYFREFFRVLDGGGTMMVHLPLYLFPRDPAKLGALISALYAVYGRLDNFRTDIKRRMGVKLMRGTPYPIRSLYLFLSGLGFKNIEFRIFPTKSNGDLHPFVFASKLGSSSFHDCPPHLP
jgi:SAM-dependent methyltransferase